MNLGEYESALADFGRAIELNPDYVEAYNNRNMIVDMQKEETIKPRITYPESTGETPEVDVVEESSVSLNLEDPRNTIPDMNKEETIKPRITYPESTGETPEVDVVEESSVSLNLEDPRLWRYVNDGILEIQFNVLPYLIIVSFYIVKLLSFIENLVRY